MRNRFIVPMVLAAGVAAAPASSQVVVRTTPRAMAPAFTMFGGETPRAVVGITTSTGDARDTLGLRVNEVAAGSPAEKAGIAEGDRIQAINGINLKLAPIDIGDQEMADAMSRRLTRELGKLAPGDAVSLRVYHDGQVRTLSLKTVDSSDLYGNSTGVQYAMAAAEHRAVLGVSLAVNGSKRDTLGVLIVGVSDGGPAAKAGIEEGNRIAAINGVNLKVDREDAGDAYVSNARYERLQREMRKVKPGDDVTLDLYADGRFKTVHLKAARASEVGGMNTFMWRGNGGLDGRRMNLEFIGPEVRENVQRAMDEVQRSLRDLRVSPGMRWMDDQGAGWRTRIDVPPDAPDAPMPARAMPPAVPSVPAMRAVAVAAPLPPLPVRPARARVIRF
ncbi:MAG: PDZ domain-containing protein [Gemmatimonadota bacterium]|nr:PDZ domain-containing protein [Gemmatimonadota bacterium]